MKRYIPKSKRKFVCDCYKDDDGYWIHLSDEVYNPTTGSRTIHADTLKDVLMELKGVVCDDGSVQKANYIRRVVW